MSKNMKRVLVLQKACFLNVSMRVAEREAKAERGNTKPYLSEEEL